MQEVRVITCVSHDARCFSYALSRDDKAVEMKRKPWELGKRRWVGSYVLIFSSVFTLLLCSAAVSCTDLPFSTQDLKPLSFLCYLSEWHCLPLERSTVCGIVRRTVCQPSYRVSLLLSAHPRKEAVDTFPDRSQVLAKGPVHSLGLMKESTLVAY